MSKSMNGWPASPTLLTRNIVIDGVTFRVADNRDVETVFIYVLTQYVSSVEGLHANQCGSFAYRPNVNNPNILSNHSSATAVDVNSLMHPNGVPVTATFTSAQIRACHAILFSVPELSEVVHWGGDWFSPLTPDGMHFELHDHDLPKLGRVADRIRALEDDMPYTEAELIAIVKKAIHAALDEEKVDKADEVSVRQGINQARNK